MSDYEQSITTLPTEPAVYALEHPTVEHDPAVVRDRSRSQRNLHRYGMFVLGIERVLRGTGTEDVRREVIAAIVTVLLRAYAGNPVAVEAGAAARSVSRIRDSVANRARKWFPRAA
jgi:hypothetical protein